MATTIVDWANDGTIPQTKTAGNWTPANFNTGKFRFTTTFTAASSGSPWRPASLTYWGVLTTNDTNGAAVWLEWDPGTSKHRLLFVAADGSTFLAAMELTWNASSAVVQTYDQSSATAGASTMTLAGAATGNGTSAGWTRASVFSGTSLYFGVWGAGGFQLPAGSVTTSDIDDGNDSLTGTLSNTLGAVGLAGTGTVLDHGQAAITTGAVGLAGTGTVAIQGQASITPGGVGLSAAGVGPNTGQAAITLDGVGLSTAGGAPAGGQANITTGAVGLAGTGTVLDHGQADITPGGVGLTAAGAVAVHGQANITPGGVGLSAAGVGPNTGQAAITLGGVGLTAGNETALGLSVYGANRVLFGTAAGTVSVTKNSPAQTTIVVVTGGRLADLATAPTDNKGGIYVAVGSALETSRWPGYGLRAWICIDGTGGSSHTVSQQFGQTAGFDEATIAVWYYAGAHVLQSYALIERAAQIGTAVCGTVTATAPAKVAQAWMGDAPTGATSTVAISSGTVIDVTTLPDHPNGYVPIAMADDSMAAGASLAPTWTHTPNQGALLISVVVQAVTGRVGSGGATLGALGLAGTGTVAHAGQASITPGAVGLAASGAVQIAGQAAITPGGVGLSAAGGAGVQGQANVTTGAVGLAGTGTVLDHGQADIATGALGLAGTGTVLDHGQAAITPGGVGLAASGAVAVQGQAAITAGALGLTGTGTVAIRGQADITPGGVGLTSFGGTGTYAASDLTMGSMILSATGAVAIDGVAPMTLGTMAVNAAGRVLVQGSAAIALGGIGLMAYNAVIADWPESVAFTLLEDTFTVTVV